MSRYVIINNEFIIIYYKYSYVINWDRSVRGDVKRERKNADYKKLALMIDTILFVGARIRVPGSYVNSIREIIN